MGGPDQVIGQLLDTMGLEDLCLKYYISLRQTLFLASLYLVVLGNIGIITLTLALKEVQSKENIQVLLLLLLTSPQRLMLIQVI